MSDCAKCGLCGYYSCERTGKSRSCEWCGDTDPKTCDLCGGSGVLNVEVCSVADLGTDKEKWVARASSCHACPMGALWVEHLTMDELTEGEQQ